MWNGTCKKLKYQTFLKLVSLILSLNTCKALKLFKTSRYWRLKESGLSYEQKSVSSDNPGQNIWEKVKE